MLTDVLTSWGAVEVSPMEAYTEIFRLGEGLLQRSDEEPGQYKSNPIAYWKNDDAEHGHFRIMFEDTFEEVLAELQKADFCILNGSTYFGRRNVQSHVSKMYALPFDLDDVTDSTLNNFFSGAYNANYYPVPQFVALSGHGVHLYYVFERPVPMFPNIKLQLKNLKYALTDRIWNQYTSTTKKPQHQGINQGFRVFGGKTKPGAPVDKVRVFRVNPHPTNLDHLSDFIPEELRIDENKLFRESKMSLADAREKYPEWYEKVVLNKDRTPKKWDISGKVNGDNPYALYDWWKRKIENGAAYGKRYFCIMCLAIYAAKCDVPFDKLQQDAYDLIPFMNELNPDMEFTKHDVDVALECYDDRYCTFPIKDISKISGVSIEKNKRNGRPQVVHLMGARAIQEINDRFNSSNWRDGNGRPEGSGTMEERVVSYAAVHPDASVTEISRALGVSRTTVYKWRKSIEK